MLCKRPYTDAHGMAFGCGQCHPCRLNKRRVWMHRIMLEAAQHEHNAFVGLSYADDRLSANNGSLAPVDLQLWIKRLRKAVEPERFRFFAVGEYGDATFRAHYHVALFGFQTCRFGRTRPLGQKQVCCDRCDVVRRTWGFGYVHLGTLEPEAAGYLAGYVVKKMTAKDDERLAGRYPEFARQSRRPGIGFSSMRSVAEVLKRHGYDRDIADVPVSLQHGSRKLPLGRYLRRVLRQELGWDGKITQAGMDEIQSELRALRLAARSDAQHPGLAWHIVEEQKGAVASLEARERIFRSRRSL